MNVKMLCLGVLSFGDANGYTIRRAIRDWFGHFGHASIGAVYPALAKATSKGEVLVIDGKAASLDKRTYRLTDKGHEALGEEVRALEGEEALRSSFLAGFFFAQYLDMDDLMRLVDKRSADLRSEQRRIRSLPMDGLSEAQRFTLRYALSMNQAAIDFLDSEGRAILSSISKELED